MIEKKCAKVRRGFVVWPILIGVFVAAVVGMVIWAYNEKMKYKQSDEVTGIVEGKEENGGMPDNVYYGVDKDGKALTERTANPEVIIFEYADYQCPYCSYTFPYLSEVIDEYQGRVALVFRTFIMSYHKNGNAAARAVNAAAKQGYWHELATELFATQDEWENLTTDAFIKTKLDGYFEKATNKKGDLEKFHEDMNSAEVQKKIEYDLSIVKKIGITGTPTFYIGGESIELGSTEEEDVKKTFREAIDKALNLK